LESDPALRSDLPYLAAVLSRFESWRLGVTVAEALGSPSRWLTHKPFVGTLVRLVALRVRRTF